MQCGACGESADVFTVVDGFEYGDCQHCGSIAVDASVMRTIDEGCFVRPYDAEYWEKELASARHRAWGASLARVAEAVLYATRPVETFIDIGCGPGYLLDALAKHLPTRSCFHGLEKFPPPKHSRHANYHVGDLADFPLACDAGVCIEVIEHLTPNMARRLAEDLAAKSRDGALYLFNTGLPAFVRNEDPDYLDPLRRGHIISWGHKALQAVFEPSGFAVLPLRSWAFAVEYRPGGPLPLPDRVWTSPNAHLLCDAEMGDALFLLGRESALVGERTEELARVSAERDALRADVAALRLEIETLQAGFVQRDARIKAMEESTSWRLTAPLRAIRSRI